MPADSVRSDGLSPASKYAGCKGAYCGAVWVWSAGPVFLRRFMRSRIHLRMLGL